MMALLLCTGFIAMHPLAMSAKEEVSSLNVVQQQKFVNGVIKDSTGEPVIGRRASCYRLPADLSAAAGRPVGRFRLLPRRTLERPVLSCGDGNGQIPPLFSLFGFSAIVL